MPEDTVPTVLISAHVWKQTHRHALRRMARARVDKDGRAMTALKTWMSACH